MASGESRVLIVGGGIGGLCLAQGLRHAGLETLVFDRGRGPVPERQGYGFHINAEGDRALRECLPPELYELHLATACPAPTGEFVLFTEAMRELFRRPLPARNSETPGAGVAVNRETLREILLAGLDAAVQFGKTLVRYEQVGGDRVQAVFADREAVLGDLLIGADGFGSAVRRQLLPAAEFDEFGYSIYGKTLLTNQLHAIVPDVFMAGMGRARDERGVTLGAAAFIKPEPFNQAVSRLAPRMALTDTPDYLRWTLSLRGQRDWHFAQLQGEQLKQFAVEVVSGWHPALRAVVEQADPQAAFPFGMFCARPVEPWQAPAVTLLGDAIHTMTPGQGEGANTALRDAALLAAKLQAAAGGKCKIPDAKREYETEMLRYGFQAAGNSRHPYFAEAMHPRGGRHAEKAARSPAP